MLATAKRRLTRCMAFWADGFETTLVSLLPSFLESDAHLLLGSRWSSPWANFSTEDGAWSSSKKTSQRGRCYGGGACLMKYSHDKTIREALAALIALWRRLAKRPTFLKGLVEEHAAATAES